MSDEKPLNAKGTRDFLPVDEIPRKDLIDRIRNVFERYGFSPMETPAIERYETLSAKFAGGSEILKEVFRLKDQGGRSLGLRYDLTVPLARVIASRRDIPLPFKRYQIQPVWRDGPVKLGRYREFYQCDADIVGSKSMLADAEILSLANDVFASLGLDTVIRLNNRKILNGILSYAGIKENQMEAILTIDKLEKIGEDGVRKELREKSFDGKAIEKLIEIISVNGENLEMLSALRKLIASGEGKEGLQEIEDILSYCEAFGVENIRFDPSLARGLEYYTGPIFEVYLRSSEISSAIAGGGRYDKMIGRFAKGVEYPATGISFGLEPIFEAMKIKKCILQKKTVTQLFVIPIGDTKKEALKIVKALRSQGIKTDLDLIGRGPSKNLDYANSLGIPFVLFVGKKELSISKVKLRNMETGEEKLIPVEDVKKEIG